jgi:hypothetical protein
MRVSSDECRASTNPDLATDDPLDLIDIQYCAKSIMLAGTSSYTASITLGGDCT